VSDNLPVEQPHEDDPVAEALRMRASDKDREKVATLLRDAYAEGRLTPVEHEERLDEAYRAQTYGELIPVLRDLPIPPGTLAIPTPNAIGTAPVGHPPVPGAGQGIIIDPSLSGAGEGALTAIFASFERKGSWTVPAQSSATCVFGSGKIDYTQAVLTARETHITAACVFGALEIVVPDGMAVRNEAAGIFGGVELPDGAAPPDAPVLIVKGAALFGSIEIRRPKSKSKWGINRG
jgi:hypothetical protein